MNDPAEEISDALVSFVNGLVNAEPTELSLAVEAENPEDPSSHLTLEHPSLQVFFFPYSDEEEKQGRGGQIFETIVVTMMVVRKISHPDFTRKILSGFVRELKQKIRVDAGKMGTYTYSRAETVTKFDVEQLHQANQFLSVVRLNYVRVMT